MSEVNLIPLICEAFGYNKTIHKDIDNLYQLRKYEFYKLSKENELYNHQIITEGSLEQEEYCKKALGILLYTQVHDEDTEIIQGMLNIIKKGWPYVYTYVSNLQEISLLEFTRRYIRKNNGIQNLSDNNINTTLAIILLLVLNMNKQITQDEYFNTVIQSLYQRLEHYNHGSPTRISLDKADVQDIERIEKLKQAIYDKIGPVKDYQSLQDHLSMTTNRNNNINLYDKITMIFDYERISSDIIGSVSFAETDVNELLYLYLCFNKDFEKIELDDAIIFFIYGFHIKSLTKAYKQVKKQYFKNNKEIMYVELEKTEKENAKLRDKLEYFASENAKLNEEITAANKSIDKLKKELELEQLKNKELNSLREFMFSSDKQIEYKIIGTDDFNIDKLNKVRAIIIGGHERWQAELKEVLTNFKFIHTDMLNYDVSILDSIDYIFICTNYINHAIYYKTIEYIKGKNIQLYYLNQQNKNIVLRKIYKLLYL